jgi:hypothetical protein
MRTIRVDRSRVEQFQRCPRSRWLAYHQDGLGISGVNKPLPLAVGGAVHKGLETLLVAYSTSNIDDLSESLPAIEDTAVSMALADLSAYRNALEVDAGELAGQAAAVSVPADEMRAQLAASLGLSIEDAGLDALVTTQASGKGKFDAWLWKEQSALVEGIVRAYARRRLRPLLAEYEVLEVEREGEWLLGTWANPITQSHPIIYDEGTELRFMSRPDALLRSRSDNSLYLLSFKTAASWDIRKARDAEHDMQGLSEGVEVERRLGKWWDMLHNGSCEGLTNSQACNEIGAGGWETAQENVDTVAYLRDLPAPPRILGIRYEYLLKGDRWKDKDLSAQVGFDARSQRSHLIRCYVNKKDDSQVNALWDFIKDDGSSSNLAWQTWKSQPVWERMSIKAWIDLLDSSQEAMSAFDSTIGLEPRALGWKSDAQVTGYLAQHPLDSVFIPPIIVYRQDDDLMDWLEQTEAQERRIAEATAELDATNDDSARRTLLNRNFPQIRRACSYPSECSYTKICYGSEEIRRNPLASGLYQIRKVNHPQELS